MMLKSKLNRASGILVAAMLILAVAASGFAAEFSADMIQKGPGRLYKGKLYLKGAKIRQEITLSTRQQVTILRPDKKLAWQLFPQDKTYMVVSEKIISGMDDPVARMRLKQMSTVKKLGKVKVNGFVCTKTQYFLRRKYPMTLTEWYADKLKHVIKMEIKTTTEVNVIEYKNIKLGGVPDSKFELPSGYRRIPTPKGPPIREPGP